MSKMLQFKEELMLLCSKFNAEIYVENYNDVPTMDVWIQGHFCDEKEYVSLNESWKFVDGLRVK